MLDRVQVVKNFTSFLVIAQSLNSTPTSPYDAATTTQKAILDQMKRVGCVALVIPGGSSVTVHDGKGGSYTVANPTATFPTYIHEIHLINGHRHIKLTGTTTIGVIVYAD